MPLPIAHGLVGASIVAALHPRPTSSRYYMPLLIGAILANCADLDFFLVWARHSKTWHRAFTHSFLFGLIVCLATLALLGGSRIKEAVAYGLAFLSHGVLDYLTAKKGGGVELLWPISTERLKLDLVGLSEVPSRMQVTELLMAILVEFTVFAPMLIAVLLMRRYSSKLMGSSASS